MFNLSTSSILTDRDPALAITKIFFEEHAMAMLNVTTVLGGPSAHHRCLQLLSEISEAGSLTKALRQELIWFYRLVHESSVGDPVTERTVAFTTIDLADHRVDEIGAEVEHFCNLLIAISELDPACDVIRRELFDPTSE